MENAAQKLNPAAQTFRLSETEPLRIPDPRKMNYQQLQMILKDLETASVDLLSRIRERAYDALERMDEIYLNGGHISPEHVDEIVRGIAVIEEMIIKKMGGRKDILRYRLDL